MGSLICFTDDPVLKALRTQFANLDTELNLIQCNYQSLRQLNERKCSAALSEATANLLAIVKYVNKADKALVYWYEKGSTIKSGLRFIGVDKRTDSIILKKTKKIKAKTAMTEAQFDRTSEVFMDGLKAVQTLNTRVNQYSISEVASARLKASEAQCQADVDAKLAELSLEKAKIEQTTIKSEFDDIPSQISGVEVQREIAQDNSGRSGAVACGSFAAAAGLSIGSFFFPPLAFLALPAASLGASSTIASCVYDSQVNDLRAQETNLVSRMGSLRSEIDSLEFLVPDLDRKRALYVDTKERIEELEGRGEALQKTSQAILAKLLQARILMSGLQMKIRGIAIALSDCRYAEARREIAGTLREIMADLNNGITSQTVKCDNDVIARIRDKLRKVENRTTNVLLIMGSNG